MSNETQKADQIAHRLYAKLSLVVNHARATFEPPPSAKVDKWFNLETPDPELFKEHTRIYRSISTASFVPLFQLQVLLCVPELATNQVLVYLAPDSSRVRIDPTPRYIVLESWNLEYSPHTGNHELTQDVAPSTMYKYGIPLFRSIFTLLRVMPAWKLARRLRRRVGGNRNGNFSVQLRVDGVEGSVRTDQILSFDTTPPPLLSVLQRNTQSLSPIIHPMGELAVSVTYLTAPNFQVDDLESLLSSRFLSEGPDFTPTLIKNQQRDSISASPGSLPLRTSLPRSPPRSIVDRFVIPPPLSSSHARSSSFSSTQAAKGSPAGSPRLGNIPLPVTRNLSGGMGASAMSDTSSRQAASIGSQEVSALAARVRRESFRSDSPSGSGVPIRRPITTVDAFKSSTISSGSPSLHSTSQSLRQQSPLSGPSLPSRPAQSPSSSRIPPSPTGNASSPVAPFRPSPPLLPSNLGAGRPPSMDGGIYGSPSGGVLAGGSPRMQGKRYSSSFGQRYAPPSGAVGEASLKGSPRSAGKEVDKGTSYLNTNTDDDDISAFVHEIDARKPLLSRREGSESPAGPSYAHAREATIREESDSAHSVSETAGASTSSLRQRTLSTPYPYPGHVLATESAVDERLREMNEAFIASLQGLGRRRDSGSSVDRADRLSSAVGTSSSRRQLDPISYLGGARRDSPLSSVGLSSEQSQSQSQSGEAGPAGIPLSSYVRPRLGSTGSTRSGFSIRSEEVLGRMDPEPGPISSAEERSGSRGPRGGG